MHHGVKNVTNGRDEINSLRRERGEISEMNNIAAATIRSLRVE